MTVNAVSELARRRGVWLDDDHRLPVAISARVRLARNVQDEAFPDWGGADVRRRVAARLLDAIRDANVVADPFIFEIPDCGESDVQVLMERRLISAELAARDSGGVLVLAPDETVALWINEEDHLRIQVMEPGMNLRRVWERADALDSLLEARLPYAFSPSLGYLTACPSNLGTGLRASVMLHLLGLRLSNDLEAVLKALDRLNLAVRGISGEGSDAAGHMFQISNQETLGRDEGAVIDDLSRVVSDVVRQEINARLRLMEDAPHIIMDCVARALVILQNARVMQSEEALDYLSALRLGVDLGLLRNLTCSKINALWIGSQPGHLQREIGPVENADERDRLRANRFREQLAGVGLRGDGAVRMANTINTDTESKTHE